MVTSREGLDIAEVVYYTPVLFLSIYVAHKHGFGRAAGWFFLITLSLLRLIGSCTGIAAVTYPNNQNLVSCSVICSTIGLTPLLLCLLGLQTRVMQGFEAPPVPPRFLRICQMPIIVGLILGILAGTNEFSTKASDRSTGHTYAKAAALLYLGSLLLLTGIAALNVIHMRRSRPEDRRYVIAGVAVLPFLFVRIIYTIISAFDYNNKDFSVVSTSSTTVIIQGIMSLLMEFIVVIIYLAAGFTTPPVPRAEAAMKQSSKSYPMTSNPSGRQYERA